MPFFRLKKRQNTGVVSIADLFTELEKPLFAYAYRITAEAEVAQDVVQEAFLKLHQSKTAIEKPKAWLYRSVHNLAINTSKRRSKETSFEASVISDFDSDVTSLPNEELEKNEILGLTRIMINQLDERSRSVVHLKFQEELSYKEISARTGISVSNVGYILHQAVSSLVNEFEKLGLRK